jgi:two-component system, OmpR family, heavy metal sensor histidine kinase CusS
VTAAVRRRTLRGRLSLVVVTVLAAWLALLAAIFAAVLVSRIDRQIDDTLRVRAQAASTLVDLRHGTVAGLRESATDSEFDSSIWVYAGTRLFSHPHAPPAVERAAARLATHPGGYASAADRRFYVLPLRQGGHRIGTIVAGLDPEPYDKTKRVVVVAAIAVAVLLVAGAYPVLRIATGRALRPMATMTGQATEWSVTAPGQRFGTEMRYEELASLASSLDGLLDRVAGVLRHERQVSAELSHELRTPLARIITEAELGRDAGPDDRRASLDAIRDTAVAMDKIIDTLLAAARVDHAGSVGRAALDPVLGELAAANTTVRADHTGLAVGVDRDLVVRILTPLVDNALRYARGEVRLAARRAGPAVAVTVANDGPRLDPDLTEAVFAPGVTVPGTTGHDGAGLGLALSRRLARAADGDVAVDPDAAWTTFVVTLPSG